MKVLYLPGLAADSRLFSPLIERLGGNSIDWLEPLNEESLTQYAQRLAQSLSDEEDSEICLVGLCFGGVVAMEMSQHLKLSSLITVNTPGDSGDISADFRKGVSLGTKMPLAVLKGLLSLKAASFFTEKDQLQEAHSKVVHDMVLDSDLEFLKWAAIASAHWERPEPLQFNCPNLALHGARDPIVKAPQRMSVELMEDVGHLAPLTHPDEISSRIQQFWKKIPAQ